MNKKAQQLEIKHQRERLLEELETIYSNAFVRISTTPLGERSIAKLTQLILRSRENALSILKEEIEKPLITRAPISQRPEMIRETKKQSEFLP